MKKLNLFPQATQVKLQPFVLLIHSTNLAKWPESLGSQRLIWTCACSKIPDQPHTRLLSPPTDQDSFAQQRFVCSTGIKRLLSKERWYRGERRYHNYLSVLATFSDVKTKPLHHKAEVLKIVSVRSVPEHHPPCRSTCQRSLCVGSKKLTKFSS